MATDTPGRAVTAFKRFDPKKGIYVHNHIEWGWHIIPKLDCVNPSKHDWKYEKGTLNSKNVFTLHRP